MSKVKPGHKEGVFRPQQLPGMCFPVLLLLAAFSVICQADIDDNESQNLISEDLYYLEAKCPATGIQELVLRRNQQFELTSFVPSTRKRSRVATGIWQLESERLTLTTAKISMHFSVKSRVHKLLDKKFLYLSFKAMSSEEKHLLQECEFVDRRVIENFINPGKKPEGPPPEKLPIQYKQKQPE